MKVPGAERAHVKLKDLHPNPFRHIEEYPLYPQKVDDLVRSIKTNQWWTNIHARPRKKGGYEIAYGHHRLAALRKVYKPEDEVQIMVAPLTDEQMLRHMIDENIEEAGGDALAEVQVIGAVLQAYAAGKIKLAVDLRGAARSRSGRGPRGLEDGPRDLKHVSSTSDRAKLPYTGAAVARYLSWSHDRFWTAFRAWHLAQDKLLDLRPFRQEVKAGRPITRGMLTTTVETAQRAKRLVRSAINTRRADATLAREAKDERTARQADAEADRIEKETKKHVRAAVKIATEQVLAEPTAVYKVRSNLPEPPGLRQKRRTVPAAAWLKTVGDFLRRIRAHDFFSTEMDHILEVVDDVNIVVPRQRQELLEAFEAALAAINERWTKHIDRLREVVTEHEPHIKNVTPIRRNLAP